MPLIVVTPPEDPALDRDGEVKQQLAVMPASRSMTTTSGGLD